MFAKIMVSQAQLLIEGLGFTLCSTQQLVALACVAGAQAGLLPLAAAPAPLAAAGIVAPYASSFNAHRINHAVAYPVAPAPVAPVALAAPAPAPVAFAAPPKVAFAAPALAPAPAFAAPALAPAPAFAAPALAPAPLAAPLAAPLGAPIGFAAPARFGLPAAFPFAAPRFPAPAPYFI